MNKQLTIDADGNTELGHIGDAPRLVEDKLNGGYAVEGEVPELSIIQGTDVSDLAHHIAPTDLPEYVADVLTVDQHMKRMTLTASNGTWTFDLYPARFWDDKGGPMFVAKLVTT